MGKPFGLGLLVIATVFCLLTAWASGTAPASFAERLGLTIANQGGKNEIRAQYAGFFFSMAIACGGALAGFIPREAAYILLSVVFGGLILGRIASLGLDRSTAGYTHTVLALYAIDAIGFLLAVTAMILD